MTPELIKQWAEQADQMADDQFQCPGEFHPDWHEVRDGFFAALVAAHQRELDAKVCDERAARALEEPWSGMDACWSGANDCAAAPRERKE